MEIARGNFLPAELVLRLSDLTGRINRELAVFINRRGTVMAVCVGDSSKVSLPEIEGRRGRSRLSGIRCIHTHPNGSGMLSSVDIRSLLELRLDAMVSIGVKEGVAGDIFAALPIQGKNGELNEPQIYGPFEVGDEKINQLLNILLEVEKECVSETTNNQEEIEKAIIVGLETSTGKDAAGRGEAERSLDELEELASTAGVSVLKKLLQKRSLKDSAYFVGKGMVEQIGLLRQSLGANTVIFDDELSGAQVRNIENVVGIKVIDRTTLILDIFAQRARSREGKLQVELAQLKYRLPRLIGLGGQLSRLGGGIGTRGPGEKKLEVDRRHIRRRIGSLEAELKVIESRRNQLREGRKNSALPTIALVGYTNAGKSTLLNKLCGSDVFAENKLFATLDPTARSLKLSDGRNAILIDTVGFIRKLPHELIEAFKSTLEEAVYADILIHVVDASSEETEVQISVVNEILKGLGALNKPIILALNKIDAVKGELILPVRDNCQKTVEISAISGKGIEDLIGEINILMPAEEKEITVFIPYSQGWAAPYVHENGRVTEQEYLEGGLKMRATINKAKIAKIEEFLM
ncbi:MAG TPA: GTPase HflX [Clostridia bacterium]|nr:GTPase HflX [Clostridia bacterium]